MLIKDITLLDFDNWYIGGVSAIYKKPDYITLVHGKSGRTVNGFIYIVSGKIECRFQKSHMIFEEGSLIYFPLKSIHSIHVSDDTYFRKINFTILDRESDEEIVFSEFPTVIYANTPKNVVEMTRRACEVFKNHRPGYSAQVTGILCNLLSEVSGDLSLKSRKSVIDDAVGIMNENLAENFSITQLSDICNISPAHFRRLFKAQFDMTPTQYRNSIRISKAKMLLRTSSLSISEIAFFLGFESEYYFSRVFKKYTGISPSEYKR